MKWSIRNCGHCGQPFNGCGPQQFCRDRECQSSRLTKPYRLGRGMIRCAICGDPLADHDVADSHVAFFAEGAGIEPAQAVT